MYQAHLLHTSPFFMPHSSESLKKKSFFKGRCPIIKVTILISPVCLRRLHQYWPQWHASGPPGLQSTVQHRRERGPVTWPVMRPSSKAGGKPPWRVIWRVLCWHAAEPASLWDTHRPFQASTARPSPALRGEGWGVGVGWSEAGERMRRVQSDEG